MNKPNILFVLLQVSETLLQSSGGKTEKIFKITEEEKMKICRGRQEVKKEEDDIQSSLL